MELPLQPPPEFWSRLSKLWNNGIWSQNAFVRFPLTEVELFLAIARGCQGSGPQVPTRFYIAGRELDAFPPQYLPRVEDGTFEGYRQRVRQENGNQEFCFLVNLLETIDFGFFSWCRDFFRELARTVGFSPIGISCGLFVGDYTRTPFGVHEDSNHVFTFPIIGRKVFRLWEQEVVASQPHFRSALDYPALIDRSEVLDVEPGGMSYWSPDRWHIAESSGEGLNVSVTLFALETQDMAGVLSTVIAFGGLGAVPPSLAHEIPGPPAFARLPNFDPSKQAELAQTPPESFTGLTQFASQQFRPEVIRGFWLQTVSAGGFSRVPPPLEEVPIEGAARLRLASQYPVLETQVTPTELAVAANGHLTFVPVEAGVRSLLAELNSGETWVAQALADRHASKAFDGPAVFALLRWLVAARALVQS